MMGVVVRLVTIPISHFCEKARWALARAGRPLPRGAPRPGHPPARGAACRGREHGAGAGHARRRLASRRDILAWADERTPADERLYPEDRPSAPRSRRSGAASTSELGPARPTADVRPHAAHRELMLRFNNQGVPRLGGPRVPRRLAPGHRFASARWTSRPAWRSATRRSCGGSFDAAPERLSDGRPYLCGDRFTAADLTFAALSAPVPSRRSTASRCRGRTSSRRRRRRSSCAPGHPAGRYALALYASRPPAPA